MGFGEELHLKPRRCLLGESTWSLESSLPHRDPVPGQYGGLVARPVRIEVCVVFGRFILMCSSRQAI